MATRIGTTQRSRAVRARAAASGVLTALVTVIIAVAYVINDAPGDDRPHTDPVADYRTMLTGLDIKGRAPMTGYDRELFGPAWTDTVDVDLGHNGCDTRNDILNRDLTGVDTRPGTSDCVVEKGTLDDPFSGETIRFTRGQSTSSLVQIDHLVPLADAWQKGAQQWDDQTRRNFANDPVNLLAVKGSLNSQKGASDAATWLPPNRAFRCDYAKMIITVKDRYDVWLTRAESEALSTQLDTCAS
ncbi:hypothetical protein HMPREF0290_0732 [Corynebacterium efficiens YS-314]|uniref:HNH endonuclease family protein n=1 Tax=Corynebacterium efficiens TaxID=152794 RepID=UPI0001B86CD6|nr:HNH endonuclease family protein [Corynebacterium efficiens]EEW50644.1 hypothetical protein HMPREF0290_0732 [Corynebacterium efficiens YS-314]